MNILHLVTGRVTTGAAAAAVSDVKSLVSVNQNAWLLCQEGTKLATATVNAGVPCLTGMKLGRGAMRILHLPHDVRKLRALVREMDIDVIHVHRSDDQLVAAAALGRSLSARLVRTWHRDPKHLARPLLSKLVTQPEGLVCVSREHEASLRGMGAAQCQYIPTAVDTKVFAPSENREVNAEIRIAHVGRWKRDSSGQDRGQRAALEIFARLSTQLPWKGILLGRGEMAETLSHEAYDELKLSRNRVELVNFQAQSPAAFAKMLGSFDLGLVFVTGSDGSSRPAAELLSCGVPLIVADLPGLREFAEDPACSQRQLPNDSNGWAHAIEKLISDRTRLPAMRQSARSRAENFHSLNARGEALISFYRNL
jgi:glycosyltransferase involved in cell wall biosynthesis